jgi:citrate lyase subunit beta/citryl-CoA lyase
MDIRPRRSALFMPAANVRAIAKARTVPCDVVILDLEDAVAPEAKAAARAQAVEAARAGGFGGRELVLRVNAPDTPWGLDDLAAANDAPFDAVLVPKVSDTATVHAVDRATRLPIWAMIETGRAFARLADIADTARDTGLAAWVIGPNDLAREMRLRGDARRATLLPLLTLAMAIGRGAGLTMLDGVYNAIGDEAGLATECAQGAALGFDGKTLIHPSQIAAANAAFAPAPDEVAEARAIVAAFDAPENAGKGVVALDGRMVELLHRDRAREVLALVAAIGGQ